MSYTANQFLSVLKKAGKALVTEDVNCPELSEDGKTDFPVHLKELNGTLMDLWNKCFEEMLEDPTLQGKYGSPSQLVVALSLVDQGGDRVFKPHDFKSHTALGEMPNHVKDRLASAAYRISKMRKVDQEALAKNSQSSPEEDSPST